MALFDEIFINKASIFQMLFFNVKAVLVYPTLDDLKISDPQMYERWKYISKAKLHVDFDIYLQMNNEIDLQKKYEENAVQYPEFCKIVAISYAKLYSENGVIKRHIKKLADDNEVMVIEQFMSLLADISNDDLKSSSLCGHNIISYDIPFLIKRYIYNRNIFQLNKTLPLILKAALNAKPWESLVIDTVNVWKFNGFEYAPLMLIVDFLGLKKTVDLKTSVDLSRDYWAMVKTDPQKAIEFVSLQSATQTNLVAQLIYELRQL